MLKKYILQPILISLVIVIGVLLGYFVSQNQQVNQTNTLALESSGGKTQQILNLIAREYVDTVHLHKLEETAVTAILDSLDPHSNYIKAADLQEVSEPLDGKFGGIGIQFNMQEDTIIVIKTIANGPSEKVGLMPGDRIITINDSIAAGVNMPTREVVRKLKGEKGTQVKVGVHRTGSEELIPFHITRDDIPLYSVDIGYMLDKTTAYIKVNNFSLTTFEEFMKEGKRLKKAGMEKLILDLRGNGGGYMSAAINIADQFLEQGQLIVYTNGRNMEKQDMYASRSGIFLTTPVVVLIDEWSASASEIVAGAIQDNDRGTIIGRRSFGKGLVQQQWNLTDGSAIRLTVAKYYTPTGRCIQKPYENGRDAYYNELSKRYQHGDYFTSDSNHYGDTSQYITKEGRILYGGGGIMPDYFVPHDTSGVNQYYKQISLKGLIYKFAFTYADHHREALSQFSTTAQLQRELKRRNLLEVFVSFAEKEGVKKPSDKELAATSTRLRTQIEAFTARNILDNAGFYPIIHEIDNTLKKALEVLHTQQNS